MINLSVRSPRAASEALPGSRAPPVPPAPLCRAAAPHAAALVPARRAPAYGPCHVPRMPSDARRISDTSPLQEIRGAIRSLRAEVRAVNPSCG